MRNPTRTISLFRAVNSTTSVSLHPTSHRGGRGHPHPPPLPRRILPRPRRPPRFLFPDASVPSPSCLHLRRDASAGLLAGQRLRRDPHERAESRRQSHRDVPQVRVPAAHPARRADGGVRLLRAGHLPGRLRWERSPRAAARGPSLHEDGQMPALRRGAAATSRCVAGRVRGMPPGHRDAGGERWGERATARELGGWCGRRVGRGGHAAHHRVPVVPDEAATSAGCAAGGVRWVQAGHAGARRRAVVTR